MGQSVTIRDVARRAGVSRQTVSRVLNDSPRVDPSTRSRVEEAIRSLDYAPSAAARRLSTGRTWCVGVVVPFMTRPSVVTRLAGIELELASTEYDMLVYNVESPAHRDKRIHELSRSGRVDGLIIVSIPLHRYETERLRATGIPTVLLDSHSPTLPRIVCNDIQGGRLAARHLLDAGHEGISFIGDFPRSPWGFSSSRLRLWGLRREILSRGVSFRPELVALGDHSRDAARELARGLLRSRNRPTATVCASDTQAIGVLEAASALGLAVPDDLSVVGYDDIEAAEYLGLTTIHQPLGESGRQAVRMLLDEMAGPRLGPRRKDLPVELVVRRTTGSAPRDIADVDRSAGEAFDGVRT